MKNLAIIPDVLSATNELMSSITKSLPPNATSEEYLQVISKHRKDISIVSRKASVIIDEYNLTDAIEEKYSEIKEYSQVNKENALPVIAWKYFVQSVTNSSEDYTVQHVFTLLPIVERSFLDYYLQAH